MSGTPSTVNDNFTGNAAEYLEMAYEAFCDAIDPELIYTATERIAPDHPLVNSMACWRALRRIRVCVVFAAFACEASANEFLAARLTADRPVFKMLDDCKTSEKLLAGTEIVLGESLFDPSAEPYQSIHALLRARNTLVHARPEIFNPAPVASYSGPAALAELGPPQAARFLVAVAQVLVDLGKHFHPVGYVAAELLVENRNYVLETGQRFNGQVPTLADRRPTPLGQLGR